MARPGFGRGADRIDPQLSGDVVQTSNRWNRHGSADESTVLARRTEPLPHGWLPGGAPVIIVAMTLLRYAAFLGLAIWIGGLAALAGLGAPVLFEVLPAHDPAGGRELAGVVFGALFERFQYVAWAAALVVLASLSLRAALGPRPKRTAIRIWTVLAMVAMSVFTVYVIIPEIDAIRASVGGVIATLPETDPRRIEHGRWHGLSSALALVTVVGGLGLAWAEVRDQQ